MRLLEKSRTGTLLSAGVVIIALLTGCGIKMGTGLGGMPRLPDAGVDPEKAWPRVQVLPNYRLSPECNVEICAALFSTGGSGLYVHKVEEAAHGRPVDFNLMWLVPYQVSDGSVLYAPLGSGPFEYTTASGAINIRFGFNPAEWPVEAGPARR